MIEQCLRNKMNYIKNLQYYRIDGSTSQQSRQNMIEKFNNNSDSKLFLISMKARCLGINLVAANRAVIFDASFNPSDDLQAIGRVYRYGQKKTTFIYRFIMDFSLEKSIYDHQIKKQQISNRIVDKENSFPFMSIKYSSYFKFEYKEQSRLFSECNQLYGYCN